MNLRVVVPGLVVVLAISACGGAVEPSPTPPPSPGPVETVEQDGVRVTLSVEWAELPVAGRSWVQVTIENRAAAAILWQGGGCKVPAQVVIDLARPVSGEPGRQWPGPAGQLKQMVWAPTDATNQAYFLDERFVHAGQRLACPANIAVNVLEPGEVLRVRAAWDGDVAGAAAPVGPARIRAAFPFMGRQQQGADPFAAPVRPIEVSADVMVFDAGLGLISPGQAVDVALSDDRFSRWIDAQTLNQWQGAELRTSVDSYVIAHPLLVNGILTDALATVDRHSGNLLSYAEVPRQVQ